MYICPWCYIVENTLVIDVSILFFHQTYEELWNVSYELLRTSFKLPQLARVSNQRSKYRFLRAKGEISRTRALKTNWRLQRRLGRLTPVNSDSYMLCLFSYVDRYEKVDQLEI